MKPTIDRVETGALIQPQPRGHPAEALLVIGSGQSSTAVILGSPPVWSRLDLLSQSTERRGPGGAGVVLAAGAVGHWFTARFRPWPGAGGPPNI